MSAYQALGWAMLVIGCASAIVAAAFCASQPENHDALTTADVIGATTMLSAWGIWIVGGVWLIVGRTA